MPGFGRCEGIEGNLSIESKRGGFDVFAPSPAPSATALNGVHQRCILSVHTLQMEIKHCERCGGDWCYRGTGRPLRCGKCKSPYWDRPRARGKRQRVRKS